MIGYGICLGLLISYLFNGADPVVLMTAGLFAIAGAVSQVAVKKQGD